MFLSLKSAKTVDPLPVIATKLDNSEIKFKAVVRLDTPVEVEYYRNGGILPAVLRNLAEA